MPAALLMANVQAAVKAFAPQDILPSELCRRVNAILCGNATPGRFMTFFSGVLDPSANRFVYACAGHNPPVLLRREGFEERLAEGGTVLGLFPQVDYEDAETVLNPGDHVVLFSDGVTEVSPDATEEFGEDRLLRIIRANAESSPDVLTKIIIQAVIEFGGGTFQDDVTLVALRADPKDYGNQL